MRIYGLFFLCLLLSACTRYQGSDITEKEHPKLKEAHELVLIQDLDGAETVLLNFSYKNPDFALTHLQLGLIYQSKNEAIKAVYHFQRYLEKRPESEKSAIITRVINVEHRRLGEEAMMSAAILDEDSPEAQIQSLRQELSNVQQKLAEAQVNLQQERLKRGSVSSGPPPDWAAERLAMLEQIRALQAGRSTETAVAVVSQADATPAVRIYTVKRGDVLSSIAQEIYGEASQWRKIYDANRDKIPNQNVLKLGIELVIPK